MTYANFEKIVSAPRLYRYMIAGGGDRNKAIILYKANVRLSQQMFGIISFFEIALRNAIDNHYSTHFGNNWLQTQSNVGGFLCARGCDNSRLNILKVMVKLGTNYTHEKTLTDLSFGFWRYMFASKEFAAGGSRLLAIFPNRPRGNNQTDVFNRLTLINQLRNRIAHQEPVCFNASTISTLTVADAYQNIVELFLWLDIDAHVFLQNIDYINEEINFINLQ